MAPGTHTEETQPDSRYVGHAACSRSHRHWSWLLGTVTHCPAFLTSTLMSSSGICNRFTSAATAAMRPVSIASHSLNCGVSVIRMKAALLFRSWLRCSLDSPRAPDGWCITRVPVSRLFWFCPPLPPERKCWTSQSWMLTDSIRTRLPDSLHNMVIIPHYGEAVL